MMLACKYMDKPLTACGCLAAPALPLHAQDPQAPAGMILAQAGGLPSDSLHRREL